MNMSNISKNVKIIINTLESNRNCILPTTGSYRFQTEDFIAKLMQNQKRENPKHSSLQAWTSDGIPRRWWLVVMIGDEDGDDSMSMSTYSQKRMPIKIQAKLTTRFLLRTITDEWASMASGLTSRTPGWAVIAPWSLFSAPG